LAYYGHKRDYQIPPGESALLRYWVLVANAKGRFSRGSTQILLDQDLATLRDGGGAKELIERLRMQVGVLETAAEELDGRNQRSASHHMAEVMQVDQPCLKRRIQELCGGLCPGAAHSLRGRAPRAIMNKGMEFPRTATWLITPTVSRNTVGVCVHPAAGRVPWHPPS